jgi:hypothetical protein
LRGNGYEKPYEVETVVIFSFQGAVAPDYGNQEVANLLRSVTEEFKPAN